MFKCFARWPLDGCRRFFFRRHRGVFRGASITRTEANYCKWQFSSRPNLSVTPTPSRRQTTGNTQRTETSATFKVTHRRRPRSYPNVSRRPSRPQPPVTAPHGPGSSTLAARTHALATLLRLGRGFQTTPPSPPLQTTFSRMQLTPYYSAV